MQYVKRLVALGYRSLFAPTTKGGWPFISFQEHKFAVKIWWEFLARSQKFGGFTLYQSFPPLSLPGLRDTKKRLLMYRFDEFTDIGSSVLDIGSNMGFVASMLASNGYHVRGVEFNPRLHFISTQLAQHLNLKNVYFENASFLEWDTDEKFDVILALAVHKWIDMPIDAFVERVCKLLSPGGVVFFESNNHSISAQDFEKETNTFISYGFKILHSQIFNDDCERKIVVLKKST